MSIEFHRVEVQGFRSFTTAQELDFDSVRGVTYLTGKNKAEPDLGANGIGKSSLFEALYWCIYGKTSRSLRAGDVNSWQGGPQCKVVIHLTIDDRAHWVTREWKPNKLLLDGKPVDQDKLISVIGLSDEAFLYAIYHAQFVPHFVDLSAAEQLAVYSDVLGLSSWDEASERCGKLRIEVERKMQDARVKVANARGTLRERSEQLEEQEAKETAWWRDHLDEMKGWADSLEAQRKVVVVLREDLRKQLPVDVSNLFKAVATKKQILKTKEDEAENLRKSLEDIERHPDRRCLTCFQPLDLKEARRIVTPMLHKLETSQGEVEDELEALQSELKRKEKAAQKVDKERNKIWKSLADAEVSVSRLEKDLKRAASQECPYDTTKLRERVGEAAEEYAAAEKKEQTYAWEANAYFYWTKAFREIRLSLVSESLLQFEISTNNVLDALGLGDWSIEYDVESETRGGKLHKGFSVRVRGPYNKEAVPFVAWSGGESQRIRLAVTVALADLIQDFTGVRSNVEIFDEPTAWLSPPGIADLLVVLAQRAKERKSSILLADHKTLDAPFARIITLIKDRHGTKIVEAR